MFFFWPISPSYEIVRHVDFEFYEVYLFGILMKLYIIEGSFKYLKYISLWFY